MYHTTLILNLSLFALHLMNRCWAQELTLTTTDTPEITTHSLLGDGNIIDKNITNDTLSDFMAFTASETAASPEITSTETISDSDPFELPSEIAFDDIITEPLANCTSFDPSFLDTNFFQSADFIVDTNYDIIKECERLRITWSGTGLTPPYRISYSKGTGDLEDTSILGDATELRCTHWEEYTWSIPAGRRGKSDIIPTFYNFISCFSEIDEF
jgi:hypothetical protein